jgi:hypothetical protein
MKLILKIAAGVFLGVIAVVMVQKSPHWLRVYKDVVYEDRMWRVMQGTTPEKVIARCGKPSEDKTETSPDGEVRSLFYVPGPEFAASFLRGMNEVNKDLGHAPETSVDLRHVLRFRRESQDRSTHLYATTYLANGKAGEEETSPISVINTLPCLDDNSIRPAWLNGFRFAVERIRGEQ